MSNLNQRIPNSLDTVTSSSGSQIPNGNITSGT